MNTGDIVVVIKPKTLPEHWKGRYGKIIDNSNDIEVLVEFNKRVDGIGSLTHSAYRDELEVVGKEL